MSLLLLAWLAVAQEPIGVPLQPPMGPLPVPPSNWLPVSPLPTGRAFEELPAVPPGSQVSLPSPNSQPAMSAAMPAAMSGSVASPTTPQSEPWPKIWEGGIELGLAGSEGNSPVFNFRFGARLKRKTESNILSSELDYRRSSNDSTETANRALLDARLEHLFPASSWTCFLHNSEDYDQFKAYKLRVSLDTGIGYRLLKDEATSLTAHFGGGTTREIGGPSDRFIPEAVFGLEGEHRISSRQKLSASVEYRPDVTEFGNYRLNGKAAWEVVLDEEKHLSMKLSALDRYDAYADGRKPNDLDYAVTLLWSF